MTADEQDALILDHLDFARNGAKRYTGLSRGRVPYDDYESAAFLGLVEAARTFDPALGHQFSTHAFHRIDTRLKRVNYDNRRQSGWMRPTAAEREQNIAQGRLPHSQRHLRRQAWPTTLDIAGPDIRPDIESAIDYDRQLAFCWTTLTRPRDRQIWTALRQGATLREIGDRLGVSWQRVSQIQARLVAGLTRAARRMQMTPGQTPRSR